LIWGRVEDQKSALQNHGREQTSGTPEEEQRGKLAKGKEKHRHPVRQERSGELGWRERTLSVSLWGKKKKTRLEKNCHPEGEGHDQAPPLGGETLRCNFGKRSRRGGGRRRWKKKKKGRFRNHRGLRPKAIPQKEVGGQNGQEKGNSPAGWVGGSRGPAQKKLTEVSTRNRTGGEPQGIEKEPLA